MGTWVEAEEVWSAVSRGELRPLRLRLEKDWYALSLPGLGGEEVLTSRLGYAETELMDCVERREVPWFLADLLALLPGPVFLRGAVALLVWDARDPDASDEERQSLAVLRPSFLSLTKDLEALLRKAREAGLSPAAQRELEVGFWEALRPDDLHWGPETSLGSAHLRPLPPSAFPSQRRALRRLAENERRKAGPSVASKVLNLGPELIESRLRSWRAVVPLWRGGGGRGTAFGEAAMAEAGEAGRGPAEVGEPRRQRLLATQGLAKDPDWGFPQLLEGVEEMTVVMPLPDGQTSTTKILISRQGRDGSLWGQLGIQSPSGCRAIQAGPFVLGSRTDAAHYVYQYLDMVTEGGRKAPASVHRNPPDPQPN